MASLILPCLCRGGGPCEAWWRAFLSAKDPSTMSRCAVPHTAQPCPGDMATCSFRLVPLPSKSRGGYSFRRHRLGRVLLRGAGRLDESDMELAQLLARDLAGGAHHQILGALVHREEDDLADVGLAGE